MGCRIPGPLRPDNRLRVRMMTPEKNTLVISTRIRLIIDACLSCYLLDDFKGGCGNQEQDEQQTIQDVVLDPAVVNEPE